METFLRLFIISHIADMGFILYRPAAARRKKNREKEARAGRRTASQEARQAPQESAEAA